MRISSALLLLPFALLSSAAYADDDRPIVNTITVHGEAVTKIAPDEVTLPVTVRSENTSLKAAKEKHDEKLRKLLALAQKEGIAKDKIQTSYTSISPEYDTDNDTPTPTRHIRGYTAETSIEFKLTDMSKLADFMNGVVDAGIDDIGSVQYGLQDEDKVKEDTLVEAMQHASQKATRIAEAAKVSIDKPIIIDEGDVDISRPMPPRPMFRMAMVANAAMAPASPDLPAGLIEIHQTVTVTYQLKP
jgi:uncharacterized protein YggE